MKIPTTRDINKVTMLGLGGEDVYYVSLFFKYLNKDIISFDIRKNNRTKYLENM